MSATLFQAFLNDMKDACLSNARAAPALAKANRLPAWLTQQDPFHQHQSNSTASLLQGENMDPVGKN